LDWTSGSNELLYAYNDIGQLTKFTDYDSEELAYAYDAVGRVTSMTDYPPSADLRHGASTTYAYDDNGRLTTLLAPGAGG
jgi:YD repeat-containing protein